MATLVSLAALVLVRGEVITRIEGIAMLLVLIGYLFSSYWLERRNREAKTCPRDAEAFEDIPLPRPWLAPVLALGGIVALVFGADMLVEGAVNIARVFGVPDAVIDPVASSGA